MIKSLIKKSLGMVADTVFRHRGWMFPDYVNLSHRINLLLFGNEQDVVRLMKRRLRPGMCVLDVGANVGWISRVCAEKVGTTGRVVAFEPDPYTRGFLEHNVKRHPNISISTIALSDVNEVSQLHIHPHSGTSNSLINFDPNALTVDVECKTIDTFLDENPDVIPNCIKIDVEGAEPKVMNGMTRTAARIPGLFLVIEFCPENLANGGYATADYYSLLKSLGMSVEIIGKDGRTQPVRDLDELMLKLGDSVYCNLLCCRNS
jgi:FkbM family methyltransferase